MQARATRRISPADRRVNDRRRAAAASMLRALIDDAAAALKLPPLAEAQREQATSWLARADRTLAATLGRRADEHLMEVRLRTRARLAADLSRDFAGVDPVEALSDTSEAQEYLRQAGERVDAFGEPLLRLTDLAPAQREKLGWTAAALLRPADGAAGHDGAAGLEITTLHALPMASAYPRAVGALASRLAEVRAAGWAGAELLAWGHIGVAAALLARHGGTTAEAVSTILLYGDTADVAALARVTAGEDRTGLAGLLLTIAQGRTEILDSAADLADDWLTEAGHLGIEEARAHLALLGLPAFYREAIGDLASPR